MLRRTPVGASSLRRLGVWLATPSGLAALFLVGLAIRLVLARGGGFPYDMASFGAWAGRLADKQPWNFYPAPGEDVGFFIDYPPGYLYVLWLLGAASKALRSGTPPELWLKLPPILADLGLAWFVGLMAERLAPPAAARRVPMRAIGAAAVLLNPAIFFISAVWGQADSVLALLVVGGFLLLGTGVQRFRREAAAIAVLAVAIGTKPQAVFVIPVVVLLLAWRHIRGGMRASDDSHERRRIAYLGLLRLLAFGVIAIATALVIFAPFRLFPVRAVEFYSDAASTYPNTSIFAFNFWGAVGFWRPDSGEAAYRFLGVPVVWWGVVAFIALGALVLGRLWASLASGQDEGRVLVFGGIAIALVSFACVTRVHERYLFLPLALGATLVGIRWLRRAFIVLSALYLINVYFPWVYYLRTVKRPAITFGGTFDAFYGTDIYGPRLRLFSIATGIVCLFVAWRGWRAMDAVPEVEAEPPPPDAGLAPSQAFEETHALPVVRRRWTLALHAVGRRNATLALAIFAGALVLRVIGLGHPPGMYFDEVYHARTGAEYLAHKEVFEYTHPPLAKELIGSSIQHLSAFGTRSGEALRASVDPSTFGARPNGVIWADTGTNPTRIVLGTLDESCRPQTTTMFAETTMRPTVIAATQNEAFVAGTEAGKPVVTRFNGGSEAWSATLPSAAAAIAVVGLRPYVVTAEGELVEISPEGEPDTIAVGAEAMSASAPDGEVWVSFPRQNEIAAWDANGDRKHVIKTNGEPHAIVAHRASERVFTAVGNQLVSYDTKGESLQAQIEGGAQMLGSVPETTHIWAVDGVQVRAIEPHSGAVIGRTTFDRAPSFLSADPVRHRLVGIADRSVECAFGRPQFAWRLGSAITGAAMVALVFLLAMRLTGNLAISVLAALFLAIEGLAFTLSRIAMNDSYAAAGLLGAWFCATSALFAYGRRSGEPSDTPPRRGATIGWLLGVGLFGGFGFASKWPVLYGMLGIALLLAWDAFAQQDRSIWRLAGGFVPSALLIGSLIVVVPLAIYIATYIPYFTLGHDFGEFVRLQQSMFNYHATLKATHPFGSPWYGWPLGYRAVYLYVHSDAAARAEMWTVPNLVVTWGGLIALAFAARRAVSTRSVALSVLVVGAAVQYLPWVAVTRVTFMYHYLPVVPFLAIALAWWLRDELRDSPYRRAATIAVTAGAGAMFAFVYPILVGFTMPIWYLDTVRNVLPWVIP